MIFELFYSTVVLLAGKIQVTLEQWIHGESCRETLEVVEVVMLNNLKERKQIKKLKQKKNMLNPSKVRFPLPIRRVLIKNKLVSVLKIETIQP